MKSKEIIIGVDEVGRGCVFGPLCVAAVAVLTDWRNPNIRDSKKIGSEARRRELATKIKNNTIWSSILVDSQEIDRFGLNVCVKYAGQVVAEALVERLVESGLNCSIRVIYDGKDHPHWAAHTNYVAESLVRADATVFQVSAASIVAKVTRDEWVHNLVREDPDYKVYNLDSHKGYGTSTHRDTIIRYGASPLHRWGATTTLIGREPERNHYAPHPITPLVDRQHKFLVPA